MSYDDELLRGIPDARGAWEVDQGVPLSRAGTGSFRNLWAACLECNREKEI
ncbi:MAG: HNH endonuclease [Candidatus Bathyarchaeota archaeon]|nr:HNH endonuclease [Candidatus Bathyarchaeota archaeon]